LQILSSIWHKRFIERAEIVSAWSKDPSTKVGAIITIGKRVVSEGYNGFPQGVPDIPAFLNDRAKKYPMVVHAELNAILFAKRDLSFHSIYVWPFFPCSSCMGAIIQSGITSIYTFDASPELKKRWGESNEIAEYMAKMAGVEVNFLPKD